MECSHRMFWLWAGWLFCFRVFCGCCFGGKSAVFAHAFMLRYVGWGGVSLGKYVENFQISCQKTFGGVRFLTERRLD